MTSAPHPLEPSPKQMRSMGVAALEALVGFIDALPQAPADGRPGGADVTEQIRSLGPREEGTDFGSLLGLVTRAGAVAAETAGPGFLAYIPGGGLYSAALASLLGAGLNRYVPQAALAPAFAEMEGSVLRWMMSLFSYPAAGRGVLTSGGSMATLAAIVTARHARLGKGGSGALYTSERAHHSVVKAATVAGIAPEDVRAIPVDPELRMDPEGLEHAIGADRDRGRAPFCVVATAGTTDSGAVDPFPEIVSVCRREGLWLHADAAYGGFFQLTERGRSRLNGIEGSDSITLDPHKGMFLPYGTGALLVREGEMLYRAHKGGGAYLDDATAPGLLNAADHSPELSRDFRGLRVWLPLMLHGVAAFRAALDEKLDLTDFVHTALASMPQLEVPWPPQLTVVAFRISAAPGEADQVNRELLRRINASQRVLLSSTVLAERFTLRICILSHRTHRDRIEEAIEVIAREAAALAGSG